MVLSDWDDTLTTLHNIAQSTALCRVAQLNLDWPLWHKALFMLWGDLRPFLSKAEDDEIKTYISKCKDYTYKSTEENFIPFFNTKTQLLILAQKHKLLLKEMEDTSKHGGSFGTDAY